MRWAVCQRPLRPLKGRRSWSKAWARAGLTRSTLGPTGRVAPRSPPSSPSLSTATSFSSQPCDLGRTKLRVSWPCYLLPRHLATLTSRATRHATRRPAARPRRLDCARRPVNPLSSTFSLSSTVSPPRCSASSSKLDQPVLTLRPLLPGPPDASRLVSSRPGCDARPFL